MTPNERRAVEVDRRTSSRIGKGSRGWSPPFLFSFFLSLLFCLKIAGLCVEGLVRFLKKSCVWKHIHVQNKSTIVFLLYKGHIKLELIGL